MGTLLVPTAHHTFSTRARARSRGWVRGTVISAHLGRRAGIRHSWPRRAFVSRPRVSALGPPGVERESCRGFPGECTGDQRDRLAVFSKP